MNRDELRERGESGVSRQVSRGVAMAFPLDAQALGSWIGVNEFGVVLCLLNRYDRAPRSHRLSRGAIIPDALAQGNADKVHAWLHRGLDPEQYNPFALIALLQDRPFRIDWDGTQRFITPIPYFGWYMTTSSSENYSEVRHYRRNLFDNWLLNGAAYQGKLPAFHLKHFPEEASKSPLMQRPRSHTKSITQIDVSSRHAELRYYDEGRLRELSHTGVAIVRPTEQQRLRVQQAV